MPSTTSPTQGTATLPPNDRKVFFDASTCTIIDFVMPETEKGQFGDKTREETEINEGHPIQVISYLEAVERRTAHYRRPPTLSTQERFEDLLNCLPPCQRRTHGDFEHFYVSERITRNIVTYCIRTGDKYWTMQDDAGLSTAELRQRVDQALADMALTHSN